MKRRQGGRPAVVVTVLVVVLLGSLGLGIAYARGALGNPTPTTTTSSTSTTSTTEPPTTTSTTAPPPPPLRPPGTYQVDTMSFNAGTTGAPAGTPGAELSTTVWYPTSKSSSAGHGLARGPFPLLVFSQGYENPPDAYQVLLSAWASAGFIVAAPTYPHTDAVPTYVDENDIVNHPAELHTVIGAVLATAAAAGNALSGRLNTSEIGLVGQSDGGDVSLAVAANTQYLYPGLKAVAILSGSELSSFGGTYFNTPTPPLLVVQDNADPVNAPACSAQLYDSAPPPKWYLDLLGASQLANAHLTPYIHLNSYETVVARVTTDFFEAELAGATAGLAAMTPAGNVAGVAQLSDASAAPTSPAGCKTI